MFSQNPTCLGCSRVVGEGRFGEGSWEALRGLARDVFPPVLVAPGWLGKEDLEREVGKL